MYMTLCCLNFFWLHKIFSGAMKALSKPKTDDKSKKEDEGTELLTKK